MTKYITSFAFAFVISTIVDNRGGMVGAGGVSAEEHIRCIHSPYYNYNDMIIATCRQYSIAWP